MLNEQILAEHRFLIFAIHNDTDDITMAYRTVSRWKELKEGIQEQLEWKLT